MPVILPRLTTSGFWGVPSVPAFALNLNASMFDAAKNVGGAANLRQYRKGNDSGYSQTAIGLDFKNTYSSTHNQTSVWTPTTGTYFEAIANAFNTNTQGLLYSNGAANGANTWTSTFSVAANRAFSFKLFRFETHESQPRQVVALMWGRWRFELADGSASIMRKSLAWTTAKQLELDTLLNTTNQLSSAQQATADALRAEIYEADYTSGVTVEANKNDVGEWIEVTFIPEPRGILNILSGDDETSVEMQDILTTRRVGELWPAGNLVLTTTGGAMAWQVGFPQFARTGTLRTPSVKWWNQTPPSMFFRGQLDESGTGTNIDLNLMLQESSINYFVQADFTSSGNYSPFLYAVEGFSEAANRTGSDVESWNSDDAVDFDDNGTPIMDFSPSYDAGRRKSATILLRYRPGTLSLPGTKKQLLNGRMCNVVLSDVPFITRGIVRSAQLSDVREGTAGVPSTTTNHEWSQLALEICDQWQIMDDDVMLDQPKGDGLRLGAYLRRILKGAGVKDSEMTGVNVNAGRVLPSAAPGEDFLITPGGDVSRGDYLRGVVTDWGMGLQLTISNAGIWTLGYPDTTIKAAFVASNVSGYRVLAPLDIVRDFGDFYNWFCVEGAEINGRVIRATWTVQNSLYATEWEGYLGRWRRFPTIRNGGIRTRSEAMWVCRSNVRNHARPGRYFTFETNFHQGLDMGDYVTLDGVICEIRRIDGGSIKYNQDRMTLVLQEVIATGA